MNKQVVQKDFIAQAETNPNGYFIVHYADERDCELIVIEEYE